MNTGILTAAWLCMLVGQAQGLPEPFYVNSRNQSVPVVVPPALRGDLREMLLYFSVDQGRNWAQADRARPEKTAFTFYAPRDGVYWLRVAQVTKAGVQTPNDTALMDGPPSMIMIVDTMKPIVRSFEAQRDGEDVYVKWDVQDDNPDRAGISILYQVKNSLDGKWTAAPLQITDAQGQMKFRPATREALIVRLNVRDLAKNESYAPREVAGAVAVESYNPPPPVQQPSVGQEAPTVPFVMPLPQKPIEVMQVVPPVMLEVAARADQSAQPQSPVAQSGRDGGAADGCGAGADGESDRGLGGIPSQPPLVKPASITAPPGGGMSPPPRKSCLSEFADDAAPQARCRS